MFGKQISMHFNLFHASKSKRALKEPISLKVTLETPENRILYGLLFPHIIKEVANKVYGLYTSVETLSPVTSEIIYLLTQTDLEKRKITQQKFIYKIKCFSLKKTCEDKLFSKFKVRVKNPPKRFHILSYRKHNLLNGKPRGSYPGCFTSFKSFSGINNRKKQVVSSQDTAMNIIKTEICRTFSDLENENKLISKEKCPMMLENNFLSMDSNEFPTSLGNNILSVSLTSSNSSDQSAYSPYKVIKLPREVKTTLLRNQKVTTSIFCKIHPFHIVFDRQMNVLQIGAAILKVNCFCFIRIFQKLS